MSHDRRHLYREISHRKMGAELPLIVLTGFWGVIGIVLPILVQFCMRNSPNKGVIQTVLALTAACCYIFWLCTFLCQLNPLYGPQIEAPVMKFIQQEWRQ